MAADEEKLALQQMQSTVPVPDVRVKINVGGRPFETMDSTLRRLPQSLLGDTERRAAYFDTSRGEFFFDRSGAGFEAVLDVYRSSGAQVVRPTNVSELQFADDLKFFGLRAGGYSIDSNVPVYQPVLHGLRGRIWSLMQPAKCQPPFLPLISVIVTLVALLSWIVTAQPDLMDEARYCGWVQLVCAIILLAELIMRCVCCPQPIQLLWDPATYLDIIATLPLITGIGIFEGEYGELSAEEFYDILMGETPDSYLACIWLIRLSRLAWSLRLWRFLRETAPGAELRRAMVASAPHLGVWTALCLMGAVFFGACVYWAEETAGQLTTVPEAVYFAIISMTTVGYGDITATSTAGKFFASCCAYYGYTMAALPVAVIVAKFSGLSTANQ